MSHVGGVIQALRRQAGLTQQQTADLAGVSVAALRDLEQGRVVAPRPATLRRLAEALRLPMDALDDLLRSAQQGRRPSDRLWVRVLGPVSVRAGGATVDLGSTRQRVLLALLALRANTPLATEALIEAVWGQTAPDNAPELLRIHVSRLRRRLREVAGGDGQVLVAAHGGYQLVAEDDQVDALMFRRLVERARAARRDGEPERVRQLFAEAMELWRGHPAADLPSLREHPAVAELTQQWRTAVVEYAEVAADLGHHAEVLPWLRQVVDADPWYEAAQARLLVALAGTGRRRAALATFNRIRRRLADELGADPGPVLLSAVRTVLRWGGAEPGPPVTASRQLPPDPTEFVGRAEELRFLRDALEPCSHGAPPTCVIEGTAGVGKTWLAVHFAHELIAGGLCADQLYVDLRGVADTPPADPYAVLGAVLTLLGVPAHQHPADLEARAALYRDRLAHSATVIVLDDAASAEQVQPLLPAGPDNVVLVTSRRSLALDGAHTLRLAEFDLPDARQLLVRTVGAERFAPEPGAMDRLIDLCGRLPLALSLVARRLCARPGWRPSELVGRLERAPDRLRELAAGSRQLRARFEQSYQALAEPERHLFRLLGRRTAGTVTVDAVAALTGQEPAAVRRQLDRLVDEHLIVAVDGERYRVPSLLYCYARSLARPEPPRRQSFLPSAGRRLVGAGA